MECDLCPLRQSCKQPVSGEFIDGVNRKKTVMIIGEAPGRNEDLKGRPFIGASGKLLREAVPDWVYLTNTVKCRPVKEDSPRKANGTPTSSEADFCASVHLRKEIEEIEPSLILFIGNTARRVAEKHPDWFLDTPFQTFKHPAWAMRNGFRKEWVKEMKLFFALYLPTYVPVGGVPAG